MFGNLVDEVVCPVTDQHRPEKRFIDMVFRDGINEGQWSFISLYITYT